MGQLKPNLFKEKYIDLDTTLARQIFDVEDLIFAVEKMKIFSNYYSENFDFKKLFEDPEELPSYGNEIFVSMNSISFILVIFYYKCFDSSSNRKFVLGQDIYKDNQELLNYHKEIIKLRNKSIAHDDNSPEEPGEINDLSNNKKVKSEHFYPNEDNRKLVIGIDKKGNSIIKPIGKKFDFLTVPYIEIKKLEPLLDVMKASLIKKREKLTEIKLNQQMDIIQKNEQKFLLKLAKNETITDADLKSWNSNLK